MIDSLYIGATGMHAQQQNIDVIANNLANVNTAAFKKNRIDFEDLLYRAVGTSRIATGQASDQGRAGMGTAIASTGKVFTDGDLKKTDQMLDLSIKGAGFFELTRPDGSSAYTRNGAFQLNADGMIANRDGFALAGSLHVPPDAKSVRIETDGRVFATIASEINAVQIGQIELVNFTNVGGLEAIGDNLYTANTASGDPIRAQAGENGMGTLSQGYLESSNVKMIDEMINLVIAQRAYEINAKIVQASDELLSISNGLYR
jgi:flagellar basal-body rod protein FlgG